MSVASSLVVLGALTLLGCGGGCGDERVPTPKNPASTGDSAVVVADGGVAIAIGDAGGVVVAPGLLDAPAGSLDGLFAGLAAAERGGADGRALLLFFGDSHTAGDSMTSHIRVAMQAKFGDAGRGLVAAGKPVARHYYQRDVRYGASGVWRASVAGKVGDAEPFGIDGLRIFGDKKGAQLWVSTCDGCGAGTSVSQFEILYQAAPDRGALRYRVDEGAWQALPTKTTAIEPPHPARQVVAVTDGPHKLTLEHMGGGQVDLYGVVMERQKPGVIVDSLGVVGRRLSQLRTWDWSVIGEQLAARDPRLVVLQYGTNEADDSTTSLADLAHNYDDTILRIRAAAPTASILILGPPDMAKRESGKQCDKRKPKKPLPDGSPAPLDPDCEWRMPALLPEIIAVQHAAAARNKVAFFDTMTAMGGAEHMDEWAQADPKVAFRDRIHFTDVGYTRWADLVTAALLGDYQTWRAQHGLPPSAVLARTPKPPLPPAGAPIGTATTSPDAGVLPGATPVEN
ncbi:hypothetical protein BH11MYX2_BH11MYX2_29140 [soil metagenome]